MTLITRMGSAMYWATVNALVQEVIPKSQFTGANAAVLVGVQSGMLIAGSSVGFLYDHLGIGGILAIDGATYFVSAFCLYQVRRGYISPREHIRYPREYSENTEATAEALESGENPEIAEAGLSLAMLRGSQRRFRIPEAAAIGAGAGRHPRDSNGRRGQCECCARGAGE
jgi:MFS family permease